MKRIALWCLLISGCVDFADAEREFCRENPSVCGDAGINPGDAGSGDAGTPDAGTMDAGAMDAGAMDAGAMDAGATDAGATDAGAMDAGAMDAGSMDAGQPDSGAPDAGNPCTNGQLDLPDESDVDCGGLCAPCDVGRGCTRAADCQTTYCPVDTCALVTAGPTEPGPAWLYVGLLNIGNITETDGRASFASARIGDKFYIAGGAITLIGGTQADRASDFTMEYGVDPASPNSPLKGIVTRARMPSQRQGCWGIGTPSGEFFVFGGAGGTGVPVNTWVRSVVANDGWDAGVSMQARFNSASPMPLPDGGALMLLASGDLVTWTPGVGFIDAGSVDAGAGILSDFTVPARASNGDVFVFAADGTQATAVRSATTGQTTVAPSAPRPHGSARALQGADGRFYLMGPGTAVDAYTPQTREWNEVNPFHEPHDFAGVGLGGDGRVYVMLGTGIGMPDGGRYSTKVEAYGPVLTASPRNGMAGLDVTLTGSNFAADASVSLYWGSNDGGILVATTRTTAAGAFSFNRFTIPDGGGPTGPITAVDSRARYPAFTPFTRQ